jgi:hypothetical protein
MDGHSANDSHVSYEINTKRREGKEKVTQLVSPYCWTDHIYLLQVTLIQDRRRRIFEMAAQKRHQLMTSDGGVVAGENSSHKLFQERLIPSEGRKKVSIDSLGIQDKDVNHMVFH